MFITVQCLGLLVKSFSITKHKLQTKGSEKYMDSARDKWYSGQRSRVRFPALPDFLRSGGSGTGSTQPPEDS
jgi:hypothetical protein